MNHESKRPVTVEDLLQLKRAERPSVEFWGNFDRELRAKQLAALVEKRPWWRSLPQLLAGTSRYALPLGATAILAVTLLATRDYSPVSPAPSIGQVVARNAAPEAPAMVAMSLPSGGTMVAEAAVAGSADFSPASNDTQSTPVETETVVESPIGVSRLVALLDAPAAAEEISPSQAMIAANLVASSDEAITARGLLTPARGFETRAMPAKVATINPLARMTPPATKGRARFEVAMAASYSSELPATRESTANVARRIGDRVHDDEAIRRIGATGNSVAWKF